MAGQLRDYSPPPEYATRGAGAASLVGFAAIIMILTGGVQALTGLVAVRDNEILADNVDHLFSFDPVTWGWIHLIVGGIVLVAGFAVQLGQTWARVVGIILAVLSAITAFLFIPYYPFWGLLIVALDVLVIWGLATYVYEPPTR